MQLSDHFCGFVDGVDIFAVDSDHPLIEQIGLPPPQTEVPVEMTGKPKAIASINALGSPS